MRIIAKQLLYIVHIDHEYINCPLFVLDCRSLSVSQDTNKHIYISPYLSIYSVRFQSRNHNIYNPFACLFDYARVCVCMSSSCVSVCVVVCHLRGQFVVFRQLNSVFLLSETFVSTLVCSDFQLLLLLCSLLLLVTHMELTLFTSNSARKRIQIESENKMLQYYN